MGKAVAQMAESKRDRKQKSAEWYDYDSWRTLRRRLFSQISNFVRREYELLASLAGQLICTFAKIGVKLNCYGIISMEKYETC